MKPPEQAPRVERMTNERLEELKAEGPRGQMKELLAECERARQAEEELTWDLGQRCADLAICRAALAAAEARVKEHQARLRQVWVRNEALAETLEQFEHDLIAAEARTKALTEALQRWADGFPMAFRCDEHFVKNSGAGTEDCPKCHEALLGVTLALLAEAQPSEVSK